MFGRKRRRREALRRTPLPAAWQAAIVRHVAYWRLLTPPERAALAGHVQVLVHEKPWEACGWASSPAIAPSRQLEPSRQTTADAGVGRYGLGVPDEMRAIIAAQAGLLLLGYPAGAPPDYFPKLSSILVYPTRYVVDAEHRQPDGTVIEGPQVRSGESWLRGAVVLAWDDVLAGAADPADGQNVVLHEFAHQLDAESGAMEGAPRLATAAAQAEWARVLGAEYERLRADLGLPGAEPRRRSEPRSVSERADGASVIRPYAATSPAEFFAVVTEIFFERPVALRARHPDLYAQFRAYYRQDPAVRFSPLTPHR